MANKRPTLDTFLTSSTDTGAVSKKTSRRSASSPIEKSKEKDKIANMPGEKRKIVYQTVYLPLLVYEQLRDLAFNERKKQHDLIMEGLDRVFKDRGRKSIAELKGKE